jgi:hypothetical protein
MMGIANDYTGSTVSCFRRLMVMTLVLNADTRMCLGEGLAGVDGHDHSDLFFDFEELHQGVL